MKRTKFSDKVKASVVSLYKGMKEALIVYVLIWAALAAPSFLYNEQFAEWYNRMIVAELQGQLGSHTQPPSPLKSI
jgi:hypothetical protein